MNLVIDDAVEVKVPTKADPEESRRRLGKNLYWFSLDLNANRWYPGQILLKGDNVALIQMVES